MMSLVGSAVVVGTGMILIWAVTGSVAGIGVNTIGGLLVLAGLVTALIWLAAWARREGAATRAVDDDARVYRR